MASATGEAVQEMADIMGRTWDSKLATTSLKLNQGQRTELANRVFAERMGYKYIKETVAALNGKSTPRLNKQMQDPVQRKLVMQEMRRYGISEDTLNTGVFKRKKISKDNFTDELTFGAHLFSRSTQFRSTAVDLPLWWQHPVMKTVVQFQSFSHNMGRMVNRDIIKPFFKNPTMANARPLLTWLGGSMVSNVVSITLRRGIYSMLTGEVDRRDQSALESAFEDLASVSPYWWIYGMYLTGKYGKVPFGATAQTVTDVVKGTARMQPGKVGEAIIGPTLSKPLKRFTE